MAYTITRDSQEKLRTAIANDLKAPKGSKRSAAAIVRALNTFLEQTGRPEKVIRESDNTEHYIRNFAGGLAWTDEVTKQLLWEMYEHEQGLIVVTPGEIKPETMCVLLGYFFQSPSLKPQPLDGITGKFLIYKKAIKDPKGLVVRGLIEFTRTRIDVLQVKEIHVNRSHIDKTATGDGPEEPVVEAWMGTLLPRERSYCLVTKETSKGIPKFATLETIHADTKGRVLSMRGDSVECVESWGGGRTFRSGIFLERLSDDFEYLLDEERIDLVTVKELRKTNAYIINHLG